MTAKELIDILQSLPNEVQDATVYFHGNNIGILNIKAATFQIVRAGDIIIDAGVFLMEKDYRELRGKFQPLAENS